MCIYGAKVKIYIYLKHLSKVKQCTVAFDLVFMLAKLETNPMN